MLIILCDEEDSCPGSTFGRSYTYNSVSLSNPVIEGCLPRRGIGSEVTGLDGESTTLHPGSHFILYDLIQCLPLPNQSEIAIFT